ncbi:MAG TPA: NosD domain-containing protein [Saprospiraceae bacterium]|nr:NosD domain-containing protein [Saprospiraceae bacterium]
MKKQLPTTDASGRNNYCNCFFLNNIFSKKLHSVMVAVFLIFIIHARVQAQVTVAGSGGAANGSYTTLKLAFDALNLVTTQAGNVITVTLSANTTETAAAVLNQPSVSSWTSLTITCTSPVTISGSITTAVIKLNGADNVTIDGRIGGTGRNLSIINNSTATATAAVWLSSLGVGLGATGNTIRNCEIACGANQVTSANNTFGIIMCGATISNTSDGNDNDNNSFIENRIIKSRYGICTRGAAANNNQNIMVSDNLIGPSAFGPDEIGKVGIFMQADNLSTVTRNTVQFVGGTFANTPSGGADRIGIAIGSESFSSAAVTTITSTNYTVTRNLIHDIIEEKTFSSLGILISTVNGTSPTNNLVCSNMIYNVKANGTGGDMAAGIGIGGGHTDMIVYNSIYMSGDVDPNAGASAPTTYGCGIRLNNTSSTSHANLTLKNNIVHMDLSSSSGPAVRFYAISGTSAAYSFGTGGEDYNDYYINPANPQLQTGGLGTGSGATLTTQFATLALWKLAYTVNQDANSIQGDPGFISSADLHINPVNPTVSNVGTPVACAFDFDNEGRSGTPDIGADEFAGIAAPPNDAGVTTVIPSPPSPALCAGNPVTLTATVKNFGSATQTAIPVYYTVNGGSPVGPVNTVGPILPNGTENVVFNGGNAFTPVMGGTYSIVVYTLLPGDATPSNDATTISYVVASAVTSYPYVEAFTATPAGWTTFVEVPMGTVAIWGLSTSTGPNGVAGNQNEKANFFGAAVGRIERLQTPVMDFSSLTNPVMHYYLSHRSFTGPEDDQLDIVISTDCGQTFSPLVPTPYSKKHSSTPSLSTLSNSGTAHTPTAVSHWRHESIDLNAYAGSPNIIIGFRAVSNFGNNLWLDNFIVSDAATICDDFVSSTGNFGCEGTSNINMNTTGDPAGGKLQVTTYTVSAPNQTFVTNTTATTQDGSIYTPTFIKPTKYFKVTYSGNTLNGYANYNINIDVSGYTPASNINRMYIMKRPDQLSAWVCVTTTASGNILTASGLNFFSDFAIGFSCANPTATVSGGGTVCSADPLPNVSIALTGTAPWDLTYSNGMTSTTVNGIMTSPYVIMGAGQGTYTVTAINDVNCVGTASGSAVVIVNSSPIVSCPPDITVCASDAPFALTGASPVGGVYSGTGVSMGIFNPQAAGTGVKTITYTYTSGGCSASCPFDITVVGTVQNTNTGFYYCSIQSAIDAIQTLNGHKIVISAGTYDENVIVNKQLEIQGAGQGVTIVRPATSNPTGGSLGSVIFLVQANNVLIHDLTTDGKNPNITGLADVDASTGIITDWSAGDWTNMTVHHVTVLDVYARGLEAANNVAATNTFNFHHNIINGVQGDANSIAILNYGEAGPIDNNTISNSNGGIYTNYSFGSNISNNNVANLAGGTGIESDNNGGAGGGSVADVISGNTITGGAYGIVIYQPDLVSDINNNTITGSATGMFVKRGSGSANIHDNEASISGAVIGIDVDSATATITNNLIYNNGIGVRFTNTGNGTVNNLNDFQGGMNPDNGRDIQLTATAGVVLASPNNSLAGDIYGVENLTATNVDATFNYWESASGPGPVGPGTGAPVSTNVLYCPWLNAPPPGGTPVSTAATIAVTETSGVAFDDAIICTGASVTLTASPAGGTYLWAPGGQTTSSITVSPTMTTMYSVSVSYPGCTNSVTQTITVNNPPAVSGPATICSGQTAQYSPMSGGTWMSSNNMIATITNTGLASGITTGMVTFTFTSTATGCSNTITANVIPIPSSTISANASIYQGSFGNIAFVPNAGMGATYAWSLSSGTITGGANTNTITYNAGSPPSMTINVTVTSANGCSSSGSTSVAVLIPAPANMTWEPDNITPTACGSSSNCCLDTLCFNLKYTPGVTGFLTTYTTGFFANCLGGMTPVGYNKSCVMTDNSFQISQCAAIDSTLFNSSGNNGGTTVPITQGAPIILHRLCLNIETGESVEIREDVITNLSSSIDQIGSGHVTEFSSYTTQTFTKPAPVIPANVVMTINCPADTVFPVPPPVLDFCGNPATPTLVSRVSTPASITCEGTKVYNFIYTDCSGYVQPWSFTYIIEYLDFTISAAPGGSIVACPALSDVVPTPPVVSDNCGRTLTPTFTDSGRPACEGTRFYVFTYTDCEGNTHNWVYAYFIEYEPIPNPVDVFTTVNCPLLANVVPTPPLVFDNCGMLLPPSGPTSTPALTAMTCEGTRTFTWTYVDCEGNTQDFNYTYTVERLPFPDPEDVNMTVSCPVQTDVVPTPPIVNDNCGTQIVPTGPLVSPIPACEGTRTYTWTYTDCEGNAGTYVFTYTVDRPPFTVPADQGSVVTCPEASNVVPVAPTVMDACGVSLVPFDTIITAPVTCQGIDVTRTYTFFYMDCTGLTKQWVYTYTVRCFPLTLRVFLEGAYDATGDSMRSTLNTNHVLPGQDKLLSPSLSVQLLAPWTPFGQPYNMPPWNYSGNLGMQYGDPSSPGAPMGVIPYPADVVDWVLVTVRKNGKLPAHNFWTCAGWVHTDGEVTFPEPCGGLTFLTGDSSYVLVQHRTHLGALTPIAASSPCVDYIINWDFTTSNSYEPIFRYGQKVVEPGVWAMHAANGEQVTSIAAISSGDLTTWRTYQNTYGYSIGDYNMSAFTESAGDESLWKANQNRTSGIIFY